MFVVDTNILLYAADADSPDHGNCRALVEVWRKQATPWYLTWGIVYEFLRVATHPRVFPKPYSPAAAWSFIEAILSSPSVTPILPTHRHQDVLAEVLREIPDIQGNLFFDFNTAVLMREHGIKTIYTRDTDFNRFAFLDVIDPVRGQRRISG